MLGLGEDGHIASLFPHGRGLTTASTCIGVQDAPKPPPRRTSLTLRVINAAQRRLVVTTGAAKAGAVARTLAAPDDATPASLLHPQMTTLICDRAARGDV